VILRLPRLTIPALLFSATVFSAEKRVKMENLPPAVQKTVQDQSRGATIHGLSQEVENGKTLYEAELKVNGRNKDLLIAAAGSVLEIEEEVALDSVPAAAKGAIQKQAGKRQIVTVESVTKGRSVVAYEAKIKTAGKTSEVRVSPDGAPAKEP